MHRFREGRKAGGREGWNERERREREIAARCRNVSTLAVILREGWEPQSEITGRYIVFICHLPAFVFAQVLLSQ